MKLGNRAAALTGSLLLSLLPLSSPEAEAGVNLHIGINLGPPAVVIPAPPPVIPIPGSYVYYAPDVDVDVLFYGGYWYRPHEGHWYRSKSYSGPWATIVVRRVPAAVLHLPPDYRHARPVYDRIPHDRLKRNWKKWERERHWDRQAERHDSGDRHQGSREHRDRDW